MNETSSGLSSSKREVPGPDASAQTFRLASGFSPSEDQERAIDVLSEGVLTGKTHQTLLGVTGSEDPRKKTDPIRERPGFENKRLWTVRKVPDPV